MSSYNKRLINKLKNTPDRNSCESYIKLLDFFDCCYLLHGQERLIKELHVYDLICITIINGLSTNDNYSTHFIGARSHAKTWYRDKILRILQNL